MLFGEASLGCIILMLISQGKNLTIRNAAVPIMAAHQLTPRDCSFPGLEGKVNQRLSKLKMISFSKGALEFGLFHS